jgi:hypothetical protein
MSDNPLFALPAQERAPLGEASPIPTPEQEHTSDQVFERELLGMVASVQFLHDLANETFRRGKEEEDEPKEPEKALDEPKE